MGVGRVLHASGISGPVHGAPGGARDVPAVRT